MDFTTNRNQAETQGAEFLSKNKQNDGVITLKSGLQYKVVKKGEGAKPLKTDSVTVHYRGTLIDGKEFDSSYKRNEPITFALGQVIPGWTEMLQLMQVGEKVIAYIPYNLAYGEEGYFGVIPPFATLIFEIELLSIPK